MWSPFLYYCCLAERIEEWFFISIYYRESWCFLGKFLVVRVDGFIRNFGIFSNLQKSWKMPVDRVFGTSHYDNLFVAIVCYGRYDKGICVLSIITA